MGLLVIASLSEFQKSAPYTLAHYAQYLQDKGYDRSYIEYFLRKLKKMLPSSLEDPDLVLDKIIKENDGYTYHLDPYQYARPEDVAGAWANYYRERPQLADEHLGQKGFDVSQMDLENILLESRGWGQRLYPAVDQLSNGYTMEKLVSDEAILDCGGELGVCIGESAGNQYRENAVKGKEELWALKAPDGGHLAVARVHIEPSGQRFLAEIRAYKNRGFRYKGYGYLIDEWLGLHPTYSYPSTVYDNAGRNTEGQEAEWDRRGGWGDDDPDDWEQDYIDDPDEDHEDDDEDDEPEPDAYSLITEDIENLDEYYDEISGDEAFLLSLVPAIVHRSDVIRPAVLAQIFRDHPVMIEPAFNTFLTDEEADSNSAWVDLFFENEGTKERMTDYVLSNYTTGQFTGPVRFSESELNKSLYYLPDDTAEEMNKVFINVVRNYKLGSPLYSELLCARDNDSAASLIALLVQKSNQQLQGQDLSRNTLNADQTDNIDELLDVVEPFLGYVYGTRNSLLAKEYVISSDSLKELLAKLFKSRFSNIDQKIFRFFHSRPDMNIGSFAAEDVLPYARDDAEMSFALGIIENILSFPRLLRDYEDPDIRNAKISDYFNNLSKAIDILADFLKGTNYDTHRGTRTRLISSICTPIQYGYEQFIPLLQAAIHKIPDLKAVNYAIKLIPNIPVEGVPQNTQDAEIRDLCKRAVLAILPEVQQQNGPEWKDLLFRVLTDRQKDFFQKEIEGNINMASLRRRMCRLSSRLDGHATDLSDELDKLLIGI